mmetsp:Transcript_21180/g.68323  ORF Transcript_21180/g.68323 Transcript_21180/m.68323 type:complete len:105 (+) Transcript_21180:2671-2985(+)
MDYKGQKLAEMIYCYLIVVVGAIAWVCGYVAESFKVTFVIWLGGLVVSMLLCVPDWPMFNRNPVEWLKEIPAKPKAANDDAIAGCAGGTAGGTGEKKKQKNKKR